jgi:hypothetical protein
MATRGYFTIISTEKDDVDPYIGKEDILVEAYHDGYFNDMLHDILNIPFSLGEKLALGEIKSYVLFYLKDILNKNKSFEENYNNIYGMQLTSGLVDSVWSSVYDLLQLTVPLKYNRINPGVTRYGHPMGFSNSFFCIEHFCDNRRVDDVFIITIKKESLDEEGVYTISEMINELNEYIKLEENKIRFNEKELTIEFYFANIIFESIVRNMIEND